MRDLIHQFSDFLRYKFRVQNIDELVPIESELSLVRSYLYIEQLRLEERLQVQMEADDCGPLMIPPLTIQPLVENAVRHGIMKHARGGSVYIRLADRGDFAELTVRDDGAGIAADTLKHILDIRAHRTAGIGLVNTDLRLKRYNGRELRITSTVGFGTSVSFAIYKEGGAAR